MLKLGVISNSMHVAMIVVMVIIVLGAGTVAEPATTIDATLMDPYGTGRLENLLAEDPALLCLYVTCQEPESPDACPEGTLYMEGVAMFGCCGSCVAFRQEGESCTGNLDPVYGTGYSNKTSREEINNNTTPTINASFAASLFRSSESNVMQSMWCGYRYYCSKNRCGEDPSRDDCSTILNQYLSDKEENRYKHYRDDYRWEPKCTPEGKYEPKQCLGPVTQQRCVCMDPDGNRIYGMAFPEQEELFYTMNCKCSRKAWERKRSGEESVTLHCLENGNYEPLQCDDGWCYCIDPETAIPYGSRLTEAAMHLLPCYNKTTTGEQYLRRCESHYHAYAKLVEDMEETGVSGPSSPIFCDQDGSYQSKQCEPGICYCYDKYMVDILSYPAGEDCQCARDQAYYAETSSIITTSCDPITGRYMEEQEQGDFKYCVDEDGIRSGPLVIKSPAYTLDCTQAALCHENGAEGTNHCEKACVQQDTSECPLEAYPNYQPPDETQR